MKVLLTGSSGLLGYQTLLALVERGYRPTGFFHKFRPKLGLLESKVDWHSLDLTAERETQARVLDLFPDVIVHTAAVSSPHDCKAKPEKARALNVNATAHLGKLARHLGARLIYVSTNMVFGKNNKGDSYRARDKTCPLNFYGTLKREGETALLEIMGEGLTILRLPLLTGNSPRQERSFHEKLLAKVAGQEKAVPLSRQMLCQPTGADNAASILVELAERPSLEGTFHWGGSDRLSPHQMGQSLFNHFGLSDKWILPLENDPPLNLTMNTDSLKRKVKTRPTSWQTQLEDFRLPDKLREALVALGAHGALKSQKLVQGRDF